MIRRLMMVEIMNERAPSVLRPCFDDSGAEESTRTERLRPPTNAELVEELRAREDEERTDPGQWDPGREDELLKSCREKTSVRRTAALLGAWMVHEDLERAIIEIRRLRGLLDG